MQYVSMWEIFQTQAETAPFCLFLYNTINIRSEGKEKRKDLLEFLSSKNSQHHSFGCCDCSMNIH